MIKEVIQPNIEKPDLVKNPLAWAKIEPVFTEWIRIVGPQIGINVSKYILGSVLSFIIGDDENRIMYWVPKFSSLAKESLSIRMNWEIGCPETPEDLKVKLSRTLAGISNQDWSTEQGFSSARRIWLTMKQEVKKMIKDDPTLTEALNYSYVTARMPELIKGWDIFLFGKPVRTDEEYLETWKTWRKRFSSC